MGKHSGGKYAGSHSTAIESAEPVLKYLEREPLVRKISLGFIVSGKSSSTSARSVRTKVEAACIRITIRGGSSLQEIRAYCSNPQHLADQISAKF